eukprot:m.206766 g.206766  ORF g.206766 m.206766 type:complete len:289 (-) comp23475_c0_seq1:247-1113(-)
MPKGKGSFKGRHGGGRMKVKSKKHWAAKAGLGKAATRAFQLAGIPAPSSRVKKAQQAGIGGSGGKNGKKKKPAQGSNAIVPYHKNQRILLVGEGNFSFAAALTKLCESALGIHATAFDGEADARKKYPDVDDHTAVVVGNGGEVHYRVDATQLHECPHLDGPYDTIVFNFPHCGLGIKDKARNVAVNQALVVGFARSAATMIHEDGEIHITVKRGEPYDTWAVPKVVTAEVPTLRLKNSYDFDPDRYPGFCHRRTLGFEKGLSEEGNAEILKEGSKTYVFSHRPPAKA